MVTEIVLSVVLLVVGIALFVLIHVCIVGRTFGSITSSTQVQRSGTMMMSRSGSGSGSIEEETKKLASYEFKEESVAVVCVVCLERLKTGERCKLLPNCNHSFHGECIDSWLIKTAACPICRAFVDMGFSTQVELQI